MASPLLNHLNNEPLVGNQFIKETIMNEWYEITLNSFEIQLINSRFTKKKGSFGDLPPQRRMLDKGYPIENKAYFMVPSTTSKATLPCPWTVAWQHLNGAKVISLEELFEFKEGLWCRSDNPAWAKYKGKPIKGSCSIMGRTIYPPETFGELTTPLNELVSYTHYNEVEVPEPVKLILKKKYHIKDGRVYQGNDIPSFYSIDGSSVGTIYPEEFVLAVLKDKAPNLNQYFDIVGATRVRNQDSFWGNYAGTAIQKAVYQLAGFEVPKLVTDTPIDRSRFSWFNNLEIIENIPSYQGNNATIIQIEGELYTRRFLLGLSVGEFRLTNLAALFVKYDGQIRYSSHPVWGPKAFSPVELKTTPKINGRNITLNDLKDWSGDMKTLSAIEYEEFMEDKLGL